jgi:hypothetical protein
LPPTLPIINEVIHLITELIVKVILPGSLLLPATSVPRLPVIQVSQLILKFCGRKHTAVTKRQVLQQRKQGI